MKRICLALAVAAIALAALIASSSTPEPAPSDAAPYAAGAASAPPRAADGLLGLGAAAADEPVGTWRRYALHLSASAELEPDSEQGARRLGLDVRGVWRATLVEHTADRRTYELRLESPEVSLPGAATAPGGEDALAEALAAPHFAVIGGDGRLVDLWVPPATDGAVWRLWYSMASAAQFARQPRDRGEWTSEELDPAGEYLAEYRRVGPGHYEKRKLRYLRVRTDDGWAERDAAALGLDGVLRIETADGDWPRSVHGVELAWTEGDDALVRVRARTEIDLSFSDSGHDDEAAERLADARGHFYRGDVAPAAGRAADAAPAASFAELTAIFESGTVEASLLVERFAATFAADPGAPAEAVAWLADNPDADPTGALAAALGAAGTPAAQDALIALATDASVSDRHASDALLELGRTREPTEASVATLLAAMEHDSRERSSTATLALGNAADALFGPRPDRAAELVAELSARLDRSTDQAEAVTLLAALGNTAAAEALAPIAARLEAPQPALRSAAAEALRLIPGDQVEGLLAGVLAGDEHPGVRARAAYALGYRPFDLGFAPLATAARSDTAPAVRAEAVTSIAGAGDGDAEASAVLAWVAANDADANVRRTAQSHL